MHFYHFIGFQVLCVCVCVLGSFEGILKILRLLWSFWSLKVFLSL